MPAGLFFCRATAYNDSMRQRASLITCSARSWPGASSSPNQDPPPGEDMSLSSYTHKKETVVVRFLNGHAIELVYPLHLSGLRSTPKHIGGRPRSDDAVRYVLNRAISDYIFTFGVPKPAPLPIGRYGLVTLALKWAEQERGRIDKSLAPKRDKDKGRDRLTISRDSLDRFLKKHFFKKKGQRLSPKKLHSIFPRLYSNSN